MGVVLMFVRDSRPTQRIGSSSRMLRALKAEISTFRVSMLLPPIVANGLFYSLSRTSRNICNLQHDFPIRRMGHIGICQYAAYTVIILIFYSSIFNVANVAPF
jgi:hypothetical protein